MKLLRLVHIGLYTLLVGVCLDLVYHTAPEAWGNTLDQVFGPGGLYAHIITGAGMILSMLVLLVDPSRTPLKRVRTKRVE